MKHRLRWRVSHACLTRDMAKEPLHAVPCPSLYFYRSSSLMTVRRVLLLSFFGVGGIVLFVGFVAGVAYWQLAGALEAVGTVPPAAAQLLTRAMWVVGGATVLGLASVGVLAWYMQRRVAGPIEELANDVHQLHVQRLDREIVSDGPRELTELAGAVNELTEDMRQQTVPRSYLNNVLDSMPEMVFALDADGRIRRANKAAQQLTGLAREALRGSALADVLPMEPPLDVTAAPSRDSVERTIHSLKGTPMPALVACSTIRDEWGDAQGIVCVVQDITELKAAEHELRASLEEKDVLLREIHHRVKNNLQVISSLLHLQSRKVASDTARGLFVDSQARIRSMALIHERLYQSEDLARVAMGAYVEELTQQVVRTYAVRPSELTVEVAAGDVPLVIDQAIPCGLIVHELVANALEHAFPDDGPGAVRVALDLAGGDVHLQVADDGAGLPDDFELSQAQSLGLKLVRGLVKQLDGTLEVDGTDGTKYTITFPHTHA